MSFARAVRDRAPGSDAVHREKRRGTTVANNYWSATTNTSNPNNAWNVNFNNGNVNNDNKDNDIYVRAVRVGS